MEKVKVNVDTSDTEQSHSCPCGYSWIHISDNYCGGCGKPIEWNIDGKLKEIT